MKRNTFYVFAGIVALLELGILWIAIEMDDPLPIQIGFIVGIILIYLARQMITEVIDDERTTFISQKSAMRTMQVFWVVFFVTSISSVIYGFNRPFPVRDARLIIIDMPPTPQGESFLGAFGFFGLAQLALLALMIFLYVGFRVYYARKYGDFDTDEE